MLHYSIFFNWIQILTNLLSDYIIRILFILAKFKNYHRSMIMSSINRLNSSFCNLKYCLKYEFIDRIVNYIWMAWKLACMLRTYKTYNSMVGFSKYKFYNTLLGSVTLVRVTSSITWTQPIYIYIYIRIMMWKIWTFKSLCNNVRRSWF